MFDDANGSQIGWLLPFAIGGGLLSLWWWRRDPRRRAFAALSLGWIALYGGVFSYAQGIFHSYYTSAMAPGVAAMAGIGAVAIIEAVRRDRMWLIAAALIIGVTAWTQIGIADREPSFYGWVRPLTVVVVIAGIGAIGLLAATRRSIAGGVALAMAGLLLLPAAWSASVTANESLNTTLPQAGPQQGASGGTFGSQAFDSGTDRLAQWLLAHRDGTTTWDLVVVNSQGASRLIAQYDLSVMSLGGFLGTDDTTTVAQFADRVANGSVRYVEVTQSGRGGGTFGRRLAGAAAFGGASSSAGAVMSAVQSACTPVRSADAPAGYEGSLYDCAGAAAALRAAGG
jgi:4-amino-4-deoxy-L-arabinose transferase-like glycosyltransferase